MSVILILVDGMRPDALKEISTAQRIMKQSAATMNATTVMPSVTLPCHMSLFHSVDPARHGTTTNIYMPQVRPIKGLCEVLAENNKKCAFFYSWENISKIFNIISDDDTLIITSDHGGHDRMHGTDLPEDMTIPMIFIGKDFAAGSEIENANIKDISPTVAALMGVAPDSEWEGKSLI